jgi:hypothetical protein
VKVLLIVLGIAIILWDFLRPRHHLQAKAGDEVPTDVTGSDRVSQSSAPNLVGHVLHPPFILIFGLLLMPFIFDLLGLAPGRGPSELISQLRWRRRSFFSSLGMNFRREHEGQLAGFSNLRGQRWR